MSKTILFGGSGTLGPVILNKNPEIISVGRTKPPEDITVRAKLNASKSLIFIKLYKKITKIVERK